MGQSLRQRRSVGGRAGGVALRVGHGLGRCRGRGVEKACHVLRAGRSWVVQRGHENGGVACLFFQHGGRCLPVLVAQAGKHDGGGLYVCLPQGRYKGGHAVGVMRAVQQKGRHGARGGHVLQAAGNKGTGKAALLCLRVLRVFAEHGGQQLPRGQREASVVFLMRPGEPQFQGCVGSASPDQRSLVDERGGFNGPRSLRELKGGAYGSRRTDGPGLVRGDGRKTVAEHVLVVHGYGGKAEHIGADGGGGVVAAAKPGLKNGHIYPLFGKGQQGEHGKELKIRQCRGGIHDLVGLGCP